MVSNEEKIKWLLDNCIDDNGRISLKDLNLGDETIVLSGIKAYNIFNNGQRAQNKIDNESQISQNYILNTFQASTVIEDRVKRYQKIRT